MVVSEHAHDIRVAAATAEVAGGARGVTHLFDSIVPLVEGGVVVRIGYGVPGQGALTVSDVVHTDWLRRTRD